MLNDLIYNVLMALIVAVAGVIARYLVPYLRTKRAAVSAEFRRTKWGWAADIVDAVVRAVEQTVSDGIHGEAKKQIAVDYIRKLLRQTGVDLTDEQLYRRYFELVLENVRKPRGYQALGHLDYVVRYGYSKAENYSYEKYEDLIDSILMELINRQIALEVNTAGLRGGLGFPNPHPDIIRRYHNLGGDLITVGSDAHSPEDVGYGMAQVRELLLDLGIHYVTEYRQKKPVMVHL